MGGAPEEQSQGTQEQIVAEEVICTVDEEVFVAVRQHGRMCTENWLWLAGSAGDGTDGRAHSSHFFAVRTRESNTCVQFFITRMLGSVHARQATVIL